MNGALEWRLSELERLVSTREDGSQEKCVTSAILDVCVRMKRIGLGPEALFALRRAHALRRGGTTPPLQLPLDVSVQVDKHCEAVREVHALAPILDTKWQNAGLVGSQAIDALRRARVAADRAQSAIDEESRSVIELLVMYNNVVARINTRIEVLVDMVRALEKQKAL